MAKKTDALGRAYLRIYELETAVQQIQAEMRETRAIVSMLLACKDIFIKRGTLTDVDIKEEIKKYLTNPDKKSDKGSNTDHIGPKLVDNNDDGLG